MKLTPDFCRGRSRTLKNGWRVSRMKRLREEKSDFYQIFWKVLEREATKI